MRKNKKALTFIVVVLGVLVLYCLMNHSEGFQQMITGPSPQQAAVNKALAAAKAAALANQTAAQKQVAARAAAAEAARNAPTNPNTKFVGTQAGVVTGL